MNSDENNIAIIRIKLTLTTISKQAPSTTNSQRRIFTSNLDRVTRVK